MEIEREKLRERGLSEGALEIALRATRRSSHKVYDARWSRYAEWCVAQNRDPVTTPVPQVLDFLTILAKEGKATTTVRGYITAIARRHDPLDGVPISYHPLVMQWNKGLGQMRPLASPALPSWRLELVLAALSKSPFEPLKFSSLKHLTWKVVSPHFFVVLFF